MLPPPAIYECIRAGAFCMGQRNGTLLFVILDIPLAARLELLKLPSPSKPVVDVVIEKVLDHACQDSDRAGSVGESMPSWWGEDSRLQGGSVLARGLIILND